MNGRTEPDVEEDKSPRLIFDPELSNLVGRLNRLAAAPVLPPLVDAAAGAIAAAAPGVAAEETGPRAPSLLPEHGTPPPVLVELLETAVALAASDLLLVVGAPPVVRVRGELRRLPGEALTAEAIRDLALPVAGRKGREALAARRFADLAFDVAGLGRFRANLHHERGRLGASFRVLPGAPPSLEEIGLPPAVARLPELVHGLVLVVGPAGSGKTTTLAAILSRILRTRAVHAITIEEPVEYLHAHHDALVEQIEIPVDCPTFAEALRSALRQSPDVLLVGEMRDPETMAAALTAAETGHLVLASVHAHTAAQAVHRVLDAFPATQQEQVRKQLAVTLAVVVAQRLLPHASGKGRVLACEVLAATDAVRNLVREGRVHQMSQAMAGQRSSGMQSLEESLASLVRRGFLARDVAERAAYHPHELEQLLGA